MEMELAEFFPTMSKDEFHTAAMFLLGKEMELEKELEKAKEAIEEMKLEKELEKANAEIMKLEKEIEEAKAEKMKLWKKIEEGTNSDNYDSDSYYYD